MYHVSAQGVDERMINVHYYYYIVIMLPAAILNVPGEHRTQETPLSQLLLMHSKT